MSCGDTRGPSAQAGSRPRYWRSAESVRAGCSVAMRWPAPGISTICMRGFSRCICAAIAGVTSSESTPRSSSTGHEVLRQRGPVGGRCLRLAFEVLFVARADGRVALDPIAAAGLVHEVVVQALAQLRRLEVRVVLVKEAHRFVELGERRRNAGEIAARFERAGGIDVGRAVGQHHRTHLLRMESDREGQADAPAERMADQREAHFRPRNLMHDLHSGSPSAKPLTR